VREPWGLKEPPWEADQIDPDLPAGRSTQCQLQAPKRREPFSTKRRRAPRLARHGNKPARRRLLQQNYLHSTRILEQPTTNYRRAETFMQDSLTHKATTTYRRDTEDAAKALHERICLEVEVGGRQKYDL